MTEFPYHNRELSRLKVSRSRHTFLCHDKALGAHRHTILCATELGHGRSFPSRDLIF